jgi:hypothetical protein
VSAIYHTEITISEYYQNKGGEGFIAIVQASQTVTVTSSNILTGKEYEVINILAGMKEKPSEKVQCAW